MTVDEIMEKEDFKNLYNQMRWNMKRNILLTIVACCIAVHSFAQVLYNPSVDDNRKGVLAELYIDVVITQGKAVTTLDMRFHNAHWGNAEGELTFRLGAHQTISDFLLDVNGKMRNSSVVEKIKGRKAYEEIVSRQVDPGLLEMTGNNSYRLRVFPIPSHGYKRAIMIYEEPLRCNASGLYYQLPLGHKGNLKKFTLKVSVANPDEPTILQTPFAGLSFAKTDDTYTAQIDTLNYLPEGTLDIVIPTQPHVFVERGKYSNGYYFLAPIHSSTPMRFISADYNHKDITDLYTIAEQNAGPLFLTGKLKSRKARIILNFGDNQTIMHRDTIWLHTSEKGRYENMLERVWTTRKIDALSMDILNNMQEMTSLGMKCGIVTNYTSLIVLETVEDYAKYRINPPIEMRDAYERLVAELDGEQEKETEANAQNVADLFGKRKKIWEAFVSEATIAAYDQKEDKREEREERRQERREAREERRQEQEDKQREWEHRLWEIENGIRRKPVRYNQGTPGKVTQRNGAIVPGKENIITGTITHSEGWGMVGAHVVLKGTTIGVIADMDGKYSLVIPAGREAVLRFAFIGCTETEVMVTKTTVDVEMNDDTYLLEEMVVTGYSDGASSGPEPVPASERIAGNEAQPTRDIDYFDFVDEALYLDSLNNLPDNAIYNVYLDMKNRYGHNPLFHIRIAMLLHKRGMEQEAFAVASVLVEESVQNPVLMRLAGKLLSELGFHEAAITILQKALAHYIDQPISYRELGMAYAAAGRYQDAVNALYEVAQHPWPEKYGDNIQAVVLTDMNAIIAKARREKVKLKLGNIDKRLVSPMPSDIRLVLGWCADNTNMGMRIRDAAGHDSYRGYHALAGGIRDDWSQAYGPVDFMVRNATDGDYRIEAYYNNSVPHQSEKVLVAWLEIYSGFGTADEQKEVIFFQANYEHRELKIERSFRK
jgi:tetratricopeptide (TPR) repeat protein